MSGTTGRISKDMLAILLSDVKTKLEEYSKLCGDEELLKSMILTFTAIEDSKWTFVYEAIKLLASYKQELSLGTKSNYMYFKQIGVILEKLFPDGKIGSYYELSTNKKISRSFVIEAYVSYSKILGKSLNQVYKDYSVELTIKEESKEKQLTPSVEISDETEILGVYYTYIIQSDIAGTKDIISKLVICIFVENKKLMFNIKSVESKNHYRGNIVYFQKMKRKYYLRLEFSMDEEMTLYSQKHKYYYTHQLFYSYYSIKSKVIGCYSGIDQNREKLVAGPAILIKLFGIETPDLIKKYENLPPEDFESNESIYELLSGNPEINEAFKDYNLISLYD